MGTHLNACCGAKDEDKGNVDLNIGNGTPELNEDIVAGQKRDLSIRAEDSQMSQMASPKQDMDLSGLNQQINEDV